jgi:hypothetical protein
VEHSLAQAFDAESIGLPDELHTHISTTTGGKSKKLADFIPDS